MLSTVVRSLSDIVVLYTRVVLLRKVDLDPPLILYLTFMECTGIVGLDIIVLYYRIVMRY